MSSLELIKTNSIINNSSTMILFNQWKKLGPVCSKISKKTLLFLVGCYRTIGTTHLGGACRFSPSCSEYAVQAIQSQSPHHAIVLIIKRIIKCRPFGPQGFDPVPSDSQQGDL